ncbi:uncharacterized protein LOC118436175 [Folsomia candida]|uniref:uncharacterized protein LOC118436175 n=1 Tax=Folsomia candida TaxID=158441 RepID=UPI00160521D2|nr:uncharacterized protein LOC118436175 [Folsomia candida]
MSRFFKSWRNLCHRCSIVVTVSLVIMFLTIYYFLQGIKEEATNGSYTTQMFTPAKTKNELIEMLTTELKNMNYPITQEDLEVAIASFKIGTKYIELSRQPLKCVYRPRLTDIWISNKYWQVLRLTESDKSDTYLYIYGAYLDTRVEPRVRIIVVSSIRKTRGPKFCQFWYSNESRVEVETVISQSSPWVWDHGENYHPLIFTCKLPQDVSKSNYTGLKSENIPNSVSLVMDKCDTATNNMKIIYDVPLVQHDFGICFKMLDFPMTRISKPLVEMIELLKILGVGGIHFPYLAVDNETMKVLKYYEATKFVTLKPYSLPGYQINLPLSRHVHLRTNLEAKRKQELIPYNDCYLSNIYRYKVIGILDIDELMLPTTEANYQKFLRKYWQSKIPKYTSFCFTMKQFVEKIIFNPNATTELRIKESNSNVSEITNHVFFDRGPVCSERRVRSYKCFHRTDSVLLVHNHYPIKCLEDQHCSSKHIPIDYAYIHHHRGISEFCQYNATSDTLDVIQNPFEYDPLIKKYAVEVMKQRDLVLKRIQNWDNNVQY